MSKPAKWSDPDHKLFPHQVGFTGPPKDWDAAPSDFLRMSPDSVGVHGRLLHTPECAHTLEQRANNFHLLEDYVYAMSEAGADVVGQVGTNWVHANGTDHDDIVRFTTEMSEKYETPFHMAGLTLVQACHELGHERIALNSVYFWPDWRDGVVRFLRSAGIDVVWAGNFVDQGFFDDQQIVNDHTWIFPGDLAARSFSYVAKEAPDVDASSSMACAISAVSPASPSGWCIESPRWRRWSRARLICRQVSSAHRVRPTDQGSTQPLAMQPPSPLVCCIITGAGCPAPGHVAWPAPRM